MQQYRNENGFLLMELLVGMCLMAIVLMAIVPLFSNTTIAVSRGNSNNYALQENRWILDLLARDISGGYYIASPNNNSSGNTFVFQRYDSSENITYALLDNELYRQVGTGIKYRLNNREHIQVSNITFQTGLTNESVAITLTLTANNQTSTQGRTIFLLNNKRGIGGN